MCPSYSFRPALALARSAHTTARTSELFTVPRSDARSHPSCRPSASSVRSDLPDAYWRRHRRRRPPRALAAPSALPFRLTRPAPRRLPSLKNESKLTWPLAAHTRTPTPHPSESPLSSFRNQPQQHGVLRRPAGGHYHPRSPRCGPLLPFPLDKSLSPALTDPPACRATRPAAHRRRLHHGLCDPRPPPGRPSVPASGPVRPCVRPFSPFFPSFGNAQTDQPSLPLAHPQDLLVARIPSSPRPRPSSGVFLPPLPPPNLASINLLALGRLPQPRRVDRQHAAAVLDRGRRARSVSRLSLLPFGTRPVGLGESS